MKKFFELGDTFMKESSWKDMALTKFCLCAMGILIGILIPFHMKKTVFAAALLVFLVTYIPLMVKVYRISRSGK